MCLLDNRYERLLENITAASGEEFNEIFKSMEYLVARLSGYTIAQYDYQKNVTQYKNKLSELKKEKGTLK